jgi:hypothetical protein
MPMIALAAFVVVTNQAIAGTPLEKAVFEAVRRRRDRLRNTPNLDRHDAAIVEQQSVIDKKLGLHMALYAITTVRGQMTMPFG